MVKKESRILAFKIGEYYSVFATFRKDFIEELYITRNPGSILDLPWILRRNMKTLEEISLILPCDHKYSILTHLLSLRVMEGGDDLVMRLKYCGLIDILACMLDKRGHIRFEPSALLYQTSEKCLVGGLYG